MELIRIRGGNALHGQIAIGGAKNAALPLMVASLLTDETLTLTNLPHLADITTLAHLLNQHGVSISMEGEGHQGGPHGRVLALRAQEITSTLAPHDIVRKIRASVLVLGPLVARCGQARVSLPGGDAIGLRPVDLHVTGLQKMGAAVDLDEGYIEASAPGGLHGAEIVFPFASVGATENLMMAACLADGETTLFNAAKEPEIVDLANCLITMGADITGAGTARIRIRGKDRLSGGTHRVIADRIETGTYLVAAAIAGGEVELTETTREPVGAIIALLEEAGVSITDTPRGLRVTRGSARPIGVDVMTEPFPGFPTDMQAQMMAMMTVCDGAGMITETIFENRFMHVPELQRMGANIKVHSASAMVRGVPQLSGAAVSATDLRASVSLVLAGLAAQGNTFIDRIYHLDRGYERLEAKSTLR